MVRCVCFGGGVVVVVVRALGIKGPAGKIKSRKTSLWQSYLQPLCWMYHRITNHENDDLRITNMVKNPFTLCQKCSKFFIHVIAFHLYNNPIVQLRKLRHRKVRCLAQDGPTSIASQMVSFYRAPHPPSWTCLRFDKDPKSELGAHKVISYSPPSSGNYIHSCDILSKFTLGDWEKRHICHQLPRHKGPGNAAVGHWRQREKGDPEPGYQGSALHKSEAPNPQEASSSMNPHLRIGFCACVATGGLLTSKGGKCPHFPSLGAQGMDL